MRVKHRAVPLNAHAKVVYIQKEVISKLKQPSCHQEARGKQMRNPRWWPKMTKMAV